LEPPIDTTGNNIRLRDLMMDKLYKPLRSLEVVENDLRLFKVKRWKYTQEWVSVPAEVKIRRGVQPRKEYANK
jgi:hypothetical protein